MFVDVKTSDGIVTVKLDNIFFEREYGDMDYVKMSISGHKDYWCKQPGMYQSWEHKSYDYSVSWEEYNRIRALMGLPPQHLRSCEIDEDPLWSRDCECLCNGRSIINTDNLNKLKDLACKYMQEHPPEIYLIEEDGGV